MIGNIIFFSVLGVLGIFGAMGTFFDKRWVWFSGFVVFVMFCVFCIVNNVFNPKLRYNDIMEHRPACDMSTARCLQRHVDWTMDSIKYTEKLHVVSDDEFRKADSLKAVLDSLHSLKK